MVAIDRVALILDAQRKGFGVVEDGDGWWLHVPARPRYPANVQGTFKSSDRAWMAAASLAMEWSEHGCYVHEDGTEIWIDG